MYYLLNLFIFCVINNIAYYFVPNFLSYNENFNKLKDEKQKYVVKNIIKSVNLFLLIPQTTNLVNCVLFDKPLKPCWDKFAKRY